MEPLDPGDPERVGRYRPLRRLGEGGMGVVYLADSWTGRKAAVKVIHEHLLTDEESRARFAREIKAAQTVSGPFTARVLHADPAADPPWLATEYLPGVSLQTAIETFEDGLPAATVRSLAVGIAEALATIHRRGVVHRDLTPRNIMLTAGGPRVIDFGISRIAGYLPVTRPDRRFGSPAYMSPENLRGAVARPADDVFSLGAVLAFAATGRPPPAAGATNADWRLDTLEDPELSEVVESCLRASPDRRPGAESLLDRLGRTGVALHGTGWLPDSVAALISFRVAQSRDVSGVLVRRDEAGEPRSDDPAAATSETAATRDDPMPRTAESTGNRGLNRRRLLVSGAVLAAAAAGSLAWFNRPVSSRQASDDSSPTTAPSSPPPSPKRRWQTRVGNSSPDLAAAGGMLLARTPDYLHGLDPGTGRVEWKHKADSAQISGDLGLFMHNEVFPATLKAVTPASGKVAWTHQPDSLLWSAVSSKDLTFVVTERVQALDSDTGRPRWSASVKADKDYGLSLVADAELVVAQGARIVALDRADGGSRWKYSPDEGVGPLTLPFLGGGLVFAFDSEFTLHAIDGRDGSAAWRVKLRPVVSRPRYRDRRLYVPNVDGDILALDTDTGDEVWTRKLGKGEGRSYGYSNVLSIHDGTLYVGGTDHRVYALDVADGKMLWTYEADATHTSGPVAVDGLVVIGLADGNLRALTEPR